MSLFSRLVAFAAMSTVLLATPALADTNTAVSAAAGAAAGTVVTNMVSGPNGNQFNCQALNIDGLSSQEISNIQSACSALKAKQPVDEKVTPDQVREWAGLAKEFGSAVGQTAKELGIAVNDFLRTPAGILLTIYLFWSKLGGIIIGIPFIMVVWTVFFKLYDRYRRTPAETEVRPVLFGLFNKMVTTKYNYRDGNEALVFGAIGSVVCILVTMFIIGVIIF